MNDTWNPETFGAWVRRCRRQLDLTQAELGAKAGCSAAAIRKIEADERKPSRQLAELLAAALHIPPTERENFLQAARGILINQASQPEPDLHTQAGFQSSRQPSDNLPTPLTLLVDRIRDTRAVSALLTDPAVRWVTLIGPPGIGKTRLSLQAGRESLVIFASGAWFVDLAPLTGAEEVLPALIRALALFEIPPASSLDELAAFLKPHALLLVLDNFEHLASAALVIADLLKRCPGLKVLATSRIPLQIYGEFEYRVPPLSIPPPEAANQPDRLGNYEAVQLLTLRIRQHQPAFTITAENAPTVVNICTRLEGIPLALELAAASLKHMGLSQLAEMMGSLGGQGWIHSLAMPARDLPARQQTLENVVDWSYRLLNPQQQDLFARLSIFHGWFEQEEVSRVCFSTVAPCSNDCLDLLESLADHSLLERSHEEDQPRWRMLEIIREYASLHLDPDLRNGLEQKKAAWFLERMTFFSGQGSLKAGSHFFLAYAVDLHVSLDWLIERNQLDAAIQLANQLDAPWWNHGYLQEGLAFIRRLLAMEGELPPQTRAAWLENAADLAWQQHDFLSALEFSRQAVEIGQEFQLTGLLPKATNRLGRIYLEQGNYPAARQALTDCLALARNEPSSLDPGTVLAQLGELALWEGDLDESERLLTEAATLLPAENSIFWAMTCVDQAEIALTRDKPNEAFQFLLESRKYSHVNTRRIVVHLLAVCETLLAAKGDQQKFILAAQILGAVDGLVFRSGIRLSTYYLEKINQRAGTLRRTLPPAVWNQAFEEGRRWEKDRAWEKAGELPVR